jgi:5'-nucleotidase
MNKKIIAIDLDEVLNNLHSDWLDVYNLEFNDNMKASDIHSWAIDEYVKPEAKNKIMDYLLEPGFFLGLGIKPHAQEITEWLSSYYELYIVTAYHPYVCRDKADWVEKHFPHIGTKNIIFCNNKGLIIADYLIDDGGHNVEAFTSGNPLLFDASWNKYLGDKYLRVKNWVDIERYFFAEINNGKENNISKLTYIPYLSKKHLTNAI